MKSTIKRKTSLIALVAGLTLILAGGAALAAPATPRTPWWDAMHDSKIMQEMRAQMTPALQEKCDQMHEQMSGWHEQHPEAPGPGNMMGGAGSGMMGGSSSGMMGGSGSGMMGGSASGSGMMSF